MKIRLSKLTWILDPILVPTWLHFATQNRPENRSRCLSKASPGILGRSWPLLSRPWPLSQRPWALFCRLWRSCAVLGRSWTILDRFLVPTWGSREGPRTEFFWQLFRVWDPLGSKTPPKSPQDLQKLPFWTIFRAFRTPQITIFDDFWSLSAPPKPLF